MSDCCQTTEEGNAICVLPADGQTSACACASEKQETPILLETSIVGAKKNLSVPTPLLSAPSLWQKVRSGIMFGVACVASPCCTPLIVPLGIALLAGTPVAAWLTANLGWVYGGLTLLSVVSLGLGFHWMKNSSGRASKSKATLQSNPPNVELYKS
jgi:hypothetical protein